MQESFARSHSGGFVRQPHQAGDWVKQGQKLCTIVNLLGEELSKRSRLRSTACVREVRVLPRIEPGGWLYILSYRNARSEEKPRVGPDQPLPSGGRGARLTAEAIGRRDPHRPNTCGGERGKPGGNNRRFFFADSGFPDANLLKSNLRRLLSG